MGTEGEGRRSLPFSLPPPFFAPVTQSTLGLNKIVKIPYPTSVKSPTTLPRYKRNQKISFGLDGIFLVLFLFLLHFAFCSKVFNDKSLLISEKRCLKELKRIVLYSFAKDSDVSEHERLESLISLYTKPKINKRYENNPSSVFTIFVKKKSCAL